MKYKNNGFTIIELMITVTVIGILAAIALPAYQDYTIKARRADAKTAILEVVLAQEKWRANHTTYGSLSDIGVSSTSDDGYYGIAVTIASGAYSVTATPQNGQVDAKCNVFTYTAATEAETVSGSSSASDCWNK